MLAIRWYANSRLQAQALRIDKAAAAAARAVGQATVAAVVPKAKVEAVSTAVTVEANSVSLVAAATSLAAASMYS